MRPTKRAIAAYNTTLASALDLAHWRLIIEDGEPSIEALASVYSIPQKSLAWLTYATALFDEPRESQRDAFVHELVHLHLYPLWWAATVHGTTLNKTAVTVLSLTEERTVDALTQLLAPGLPYPPWTLRQRKAHDHDDE